MVFFNIICASCVFVYTCGYGRSCVFVCWVCVSMCVFFLFVCLSRLIQIDEDFISGSFSLLMVCRVAKFFLSMYRLYHIPCLIRIWNKWAYSYTLWIIPAFGTRIVENPELGSRFENGISNAKKKIKSFFVYCLHISENSRE